MSIKGLGGKTMQEFAKKITDIFVRVFAQTCQNSSYYLKYWNYFSFAIQFFFFFQNHPFHRFKNIYILYTWIYWITCCKFFCTAPLIRWQLQLLIRFLSEQLFYYCFSPVFFFKLDQEEDIIGLFALKDFQYYKVKSGK